MTDPTTLTLPPTSRFPAIVKLPVALTSGLSRVTSGAFTVTGMLQNVQILIANELGLPDTHQSYDMLGAVVSERCPVALASSALAFALASSSDALRLRLFFVSPLVVLLPTLLGTATVSPFSIL